MNIRDGILSNAARTAVLAQLKQVKTHISQGRWLGTRNLSYRNEYAFRRASHQEGAEFISTSSILHLYDGWCYLGNALRALVKNEPFVVGHLAYYAELRAAMSLLASMGMVNIDKEIFCIDKLMHIRRVPSLGYDIKGTHQIVWKLLEEAVSIRNQPAEFLKLHKIFRIGGLTLEDWVVGMSGGESGMSIVSEYVKKWGVDIQNYDSDRKIRNKLSYDISTFQGVTRNDYDGVIKLLQDFWSCFEPVGAENFSIDFYLLWLIMQNVRKVKGWDEETYKLKLIAFLQTTALSEADQTRYVNILTRTARSFSALLKLGRSFSVGSGKYYLHIISRATILLRIATVACGDAFQKAGLHASDVEWWINTFAEEKGEASCISVGA